MNAEAEEAFTSLYEEFTGDKRRFEDIASLAKLEVAVNIFEPELRRLHEDVTLENLPLALASFHVYRTYIEPYADLIDDADRAEIGRANVSEELRRILFLQEPGNEDFVVRFQQTTGPVMAKGMEDTAFYRYFRLAALNEVGGDPARFGLSVSEFHEANAARAARFPLHMLTTYTHDTKRSPDVRSRIAALSWFPDEWAGRVRAWHGELGGLDDPREELPRLSDTRRGVADRAGAPRCLPREGAARRQGEHGLAGAERGARTNCPGVRGARGRRARARSVPRARAGRRTQAGACQLLLKLTSPGVPDIYRGDELEDLSLVDPDNRRPVDWAARSAALRGLQAGDDPDEATAKLYVIWRTLAVRREHPDAFAGAYDPVDAGPGVCAFVRGGAVLVAAAVRPDAGVALPAGWRDVLGMQGLALGTLGAGSGCRSPGPSNA